MVLSPAFQWIHKCLEGERQTGRAVRQKKAEAKKRKSPSRMDLTDILCFRFFHWVTLSCTLWELTPPFSNKIPVKPPLSGKYLV